MNDGYSAADRARWVAEDPITKRTDRDEFARDRGRLIHSAALRRLGAKTQVVQPGSDDFVRTRLTHSLEVAQIGREFGMVLGCQADVVDTACLAHDLGHPPFGHHGESVLDALAAEIGGFEGNAQTLRILTRLEPKRCHRDGRPAGLNLTRASLDAATKYPWPRGDAPNGSAKFGVYQDDAPVFSFIRQQAPGGRSCLEAQVMDWADDVAYSVHDLEDAVAAGWVDLRALHAGEQLAEIVRLASTRYAASLSESTVQQAAQVLLDQGWLPAEFDGSRGALAQLKDTTSRLIGHFLGAAERATRQVHGPGPLVRYEAHLVIPEPILAQCAVLKSIAAVLVMQQQARQRIYQEQSEVLQGLVAAYEQRPEERLDPELRGDYRAAGSEATARRAIIDQVASLTDVRAQVLYRQWC